MYSKRKRRAQILVNYQWNCYLAKTWLNLHTVDLSTLRTFWLQLNPVWVWTQNHFQKSLSAGAFQVQFVQTLYDQLYIIFTSYVMKQGQRNKLDLFQSLEEKSPTSRQILIMKSIHNIESPERKKYCSVFKLYLFGARYISLSFFSQFPVKKVISSLNMEIYSKTFIQVGTYVNIHASLSRTS